MRHQNLTLWGTCIPPDTKRKVGCDFPALAVNWVLTALCLLTHFLASEPSGITFRDIRTATDASLDGLDLEIFIAEGFGSLQDLFVNLSLY